MQFFRRLVAPLVVVALAAVAHAAPPLEVSIDFEGGSAEVESIDQDARLVRIVPTLHPDRGWQCWWYFQLSGIEPGETITLDVGNGSWATPDRAAVSLDGEIWQQTAPGRRQGKRIAYRHPVEAAEVWFAWGPAFTPAHAKALVERIAREHDFATKFNLCDTRAGRPTPALRIAPAAAKPKYGIWVQARQHAWEVGSSWVLEGFVDWLVSDDARAERLRSEAEIVLVPIMDIDNTIIGAGGKEQKPHDHNRDWSDQPHWPSVAAAIAGIEQMDAAGRFDLFLDLHNPGAGSRLPFYYVAPGEIMTDTGRANLARFLEDSRKEITGPLRIADKPQVTGANYDKRWRRISKNWVVEHTAPHVVAVTLETAWNTPHSTVDGYETVGRQLGLAVERYLQTDPRQPPMEAAGD
jgi:hypothetical protein